MRRWLTAAAIAGGAVAPAIAGQAASGPYASDAWSGMPQPVATGKPRIDWPPAAVGPTDARPCAPALPCGSRLIGTVRRDGAIELHAPALRW
jgi:hypothetical protein